ncbi:MAG: hypothetical protein JO041_03870 [Acidobacteria bacterium]|nr:hypothetical protein [Acidobacteriota bacterium]
MSSRPNVESPASAVPASSATAALFLFVAWLVPGAGHALLKRWWRAALLFSCIVLFFVLGLAMEGKIYTPNTGEILDMLGFLGDIGAGGLYLLTRAMDWGHGAIQMATADYGTKFIICAGLLNIIAAVDAHNIALGKKK